MDVEADYDPHYVDGYDCNDVGNEPRPDTVVYNPIFALLKEKCREVTHLLRDPLANSTYQNNVTKGLLQEVQIRTKEDFPEEIMFAIAGDMKSGKSSVINSLLSMGTIARKGDAGGSCTWVVQRFMKTFANQNAPFAAKVKCFNHVEIRDIITSLVAKYYRAAGLDKREDEDDVETDDNVVENFGDVTTVLTALKALFCEQDEFSSDKKYLSKATSPDDERIIDQLVQWAIDITAQRLQNDDSIYVEASTPEDLLWNLQPYTYHLEGEEYEGIVEPWPLVSCIDFGLHHPLLEAGIVLVDSPGYSDANSTRSSNAVLHHRQCTHKIAVADIGRALDDKALRENLSLGFRTRGSGHTLLVLTCGDAIDEDTLVNGTPLQKKQEQQLKSEIKELRSQKLRLNQRRQRLSRIDALELDDEARELGQKIKAKIDQWDACRIEMRNAKVVKDIQAQYRELTRDPRSLNAFAVGNEVYKQYQAGFDSDERPALTVKQTGIPALRRCLYQLPSEGKLNEALHLATTQLPSLTNSFELFCLKTHMARRGEIEGIILEPAHRMRGIIKKHFENLKADAHRLILDPMREYEADWITVARRLCRQWGKWYYPHHLQFLKKEGFRKGKGKGGIDISWNRELCEIKREDLDDWFKNFQAAINPMINTLGQEIMTLTDQCRAKVKNDRQFNLMALAPFLENFNIEKGNMKKRILATCRNLRIDTSHIFEDAILPSPNNYLVKAMSKIYTDVQVHKGAGAPAKRVQVFERKVAAMNGVWMKVHDGIEQAIDKLLAHHEKSLTATLLQVYGSIHKKFTLMCDDTAVKTEEEKMQEEILREEMLKSLIKAKEMLDGEVKELAEKCKNYTAVKEEKSLFVPEV